MRCPYLRIFPKNIKFNRIFFSVIALLIVVSVYVIISLPEDPRKVNIAIDIPAETESLPFDVVYRSKVCKKKYRDGDFNTRYKDDYLYAEVIPQLRDKHAVYEEYIAFDKGGYCKWKLSEINVSLKYKEGVNIINGIEQDSLINFTFIFDNREYYTSNGADAVIVKGNLLVKEDFYPIKIEFPREGYPTMIRAEGRKTDYIYMLDGTQNILI